VALQLRDLCQTDETINVNYEAYQLDWWRGHPANSQGQKLYHFGRILGQQLDEPRPNKAERNF
jgi:hypothetical protein